MPEHDHQQQSPLHRKSRKSRLSLLLVALLLLAATGSAIFLYTRSQAPRPQVSGEQEAKPGPALHAPDQEALPAKSPEPEIEGETLPGNEPQPVGTDQARQCTELAKKLHGFFQHLDQQEYLQQSSLKGPSQAHFIGLADKLLANPPVVARETDDLYTILRNTAHIFRVIGKENILLIKAILDREGDKIEDVAGDLYLWLTTEGCQEELLPFSPPLAKAYEYAGFFLNTLGGRSYLFRRDSRTRLLVNYYAILIIDRANTLGINRHGIDIRPAIRLLIPELESSTQLIHKENYLDRLYQLHEILPQQNSAAE